MCQHECDCDTCRKEGSGVSAFTCHIKIPLCPMGADVQSLIHREPVAINSVSVAVFGSYCPVHAVKEKVMLE